MRTIGLILFLISLTSCSTTEPPDNPEPVLKLELEDVSCTEAWIKLTTDNLQLPTTITLKQNEETIETINLSTTDSLFYIDSLLPNLTYTFKATCHSGLSGISSNEVTVTTMDTTSHNFTWQTFTFGEHSNSVLYDVAIIDENNIWAVGEIYMYDSLGNPDYNAYNAVHWDGIKWNLHQIIFYTFCPGGTGSGSYPAKAVFAIDNETIVVASGSQVAYLKNGIQTKRECIPATVNKIWGSSSSDLYVVGNGGNIAHWNGVKWTKIESGTTVDLLDVWGSPDGTVWTCGYNSEDAFTTLLRFDGLQWNKVYEGSPNNMNNNEYIGPTSGVWTNTKFFTYVASWGKIYRQPNNNILNIQRVTPNFSDVAFAIRGTSHNNIFITGQHGLVGHYNGNTYKEITELKDEDEYLLKIDAKNNKAVCVGYNYQGFAGSSAIIHIININ